MAKKLSLLDQWLEQLVWKIEDAKREVARAAKQMAQRAEEAKISAEALLADKPLSLSWVTFAEGDLRRAQEAKANLEKLIENQKELLFLSKSMKEEN